MRQQRESNMKLRNWSLTAAGLVVVAGLIAGQAIGQTKPPTEAKGVAMADPVLVALGPEKGNLKLRTRVFTVQPGGVVPLHDHKDNPTVAYYYGGSLSEFSATGKAGGVRGGGKAFADDRTVNHWYENHSKEAVVIVVSDVVKE
jgi:quercetin dioxygenase-like cupin family protein